MADEQRSFHLFPKLPAELRLAVWRECLPHRVCEIDYSVAHTVFFKRGDDSCPWPCRLYPSTNLNSVPPAISRVCRESRKVAVEAGGFAEDTDDIPEESRWYCWNQRCHLWWRDRQRDSVHLNWNPIYDVEFEGVGDPLRFFEWHGAQTSAGRYSLTDFFLIERGDPWQNWELITGEPIPEKLIVPLDESEAKVLATLLKLPECLVVVGHIVIHSDWKSAAATGFFGLLGDAPVQVVDAADKERVDALFKLAEECERKYDVAHAQDFSRQPFETMREEFDKLLYLKFRSKDLVKALRPAYMFRLCTGMCNCVGKVKFPF